MKRALLLALLLIPSTVGAVPTLVPRLVHAGFVTCPNCGYFPQPPLYTFDGILTVIAPTGEYFAPGLGGNIRAGSDIGEVAAMSGTLNGDPITFDPGTGLSRSWVLDDYFPGLIGFSTSDGRRWGLAYDRAPLPLFGGGGGPTTPVLWRVLEVTPTPEPHPALLVGLGLPMIVLLARRLRACPTENRMPVYPVTPSTHPR